MIREQLKNWLANRRAPTVEPEVREPANMQRFSRDEMEVAVSVAYLTGTSRLSAPLAWNRALLAVERHRRESNRLSRKSRQPRKTVTIPEMEAPAGGN